MRPLLADLGRDYRGGQHQALLLAQGLLARGHSPLLIALRGSVLAWRARDAGIRVHSVGLRWRRLAAALAMRGLLSAGDIDLIHANEPHALTSAWLARAHRRVPLIVSRRVIFPLAGGAISRSRYRAATRIIAVSRYVARQLAASGFAGEQVAIIPDGISIPRACSADRQSAARRQLGIPPEVPLIGCVAALTPDKGQDLLIRAVGSLRGQIPQCRLLLVGQGPCEAKLKRLAADEKLDGAVRFLGFVEDLDQVYEALDVFAFPAQTEALGSALLLAMAHQLPCVALARGGIPEVIQDGDNGVLIQHPRVDEIATAIEAVLANPGNTRRMAAAARATVLRDFSADRMIEATVALYTVVMQDKQTS